MPLGPVVPNPGVRRSIFLAAFERAWSPWWVTVEQEDVRSLWRCDWKRASLSASVFPLMPLCPLPHMNIVSKCAWSLLASFRLMVSSMSDVGGCPSQIP